MVYVIVISLRWQLHILPNFSHAPGVLANMATMQDTFEDAPDITPRPRAKSPTSTRSLTERRTSSATLDKTLSGDGAADADTPPVVTKGEEVKTNGHANEEEKVKRISTSGLDEVNLGEGESTVLFWHTNFQPR